MITMRYNTAKKTNSQKAEAPTLITRPKKQQPNGQNILESINPPLTSDAERSSSHTRHRSWRNIYPAKTRPTAP